MYSSGSFTALDDYLNRRSYLLASPFVISPSWFCPVSPDVIS
jgi:hypothetical protein